MIYRKILETAVFLLMMSCSYHGSTVSEPLTKVSEPLTTESLIGKWVGYVENTDRQKAVVVFDKEFVRTEVITDPVSITTRRYKAEIMDGKIKVKIDGMDETLYAYITDNQL